MISQPHNIRRERLEASGAVQLRYSLTLPDRSQTAPPFPLILALHYGWDRRQPVPAFFGAAFLSGLIQPALAELDPVIAAPDCPDGSWTTSKSERALLELLDFLQESHDIDPDKTLVTGYSLGGAGAWHLACQHPDLFAAAIPMAGWPPENTAAVPSIPLYIIHSRDDEVVPLQPVAKAARSIKEEGIPVQFEVVTGITHFETHRFREHLKRTVPWVRERWGI